VCHKLAAVFNKKGASDATLLILFWPLYSPPLAIPPPRPRQIGRNAILLEAFQNTVIEEFLSSTNDLQTPVKTKPLTQTRHNVIITQPQPDISSFNSSFLHQSPSYSPVFTTAPARISTKPSLSRDEGLSPLARRSLSHGNGLVLEYFRK
jgi:hypothetical protein